MTETSGLLSYFSILLRKIEKYNAFRCASGASKCFPETMCRLRRHIVSVRKYERLRRSYLLYGRRRRPSKSEAELRKKRFARATRARIRWTIEEDRRPKATAGPSWFAVKTNWDEARSEANCANIARQRDTSRLLFLLKILVRSTVIFAESCWKWTLNPNLRVSKSIEFNLNLIKNQ